jgi:hypothetical protein
MKSLQTIIFRGLIASATLAIFGSIASVSKANLSNSDWVTAGDNQILNDSSTGLQWLGLDETAGLSYTQVASQLGSGGTYDGFAFATVSQIDALFADAGIPNVDAGFEGTSANLPGVTSLLGLWNANLAGVYEATSGPFGYFLTAGVGTGLVWIPEGTYGVTGTAEATDGPDRAFAGGDATFSESYLGSALVRVGTASAPDGGETIALLGAAFAGLAMLRRRFGK